MTRTLGLMIAALVLAAVFGCKMHLTTDLYTTDLYTTDLYTTDLYTTDILHAASGTADLTAPARMAFQVPGTGKRDEHATAVAEIMAGIVEEFSPKGCQRVEMEAFLLADTQIPLLSRSAWTESDALFGTVFIKEDEAINANLVMNREKYGILTRRMKDKFHQTVNLAESKVVIVLNNDLRDSVSL